VGEPAFLRRQWRDVRGNFKFEVLKAIVIASASAVIQFVGRLPAWALPLAIFVLSLGTLLYFDRRRTVSNGHAPVFRSPPLSPLEQRLVLDARAAFAALTWPQKIALCVVYHHPGQFVGALSRTLSGMGFENPHENLTQPLLLTNLVEQTGAMEVHPARNPVIYRAIETLLDEIPRC
jgi:hypothetical protein